MTNIQAQLEQLFEFIKHLNTLLDNEEYEQFQEQQNALTEKIKALLDNNSEAGLTTVVSQLKQLESNIDQLQERSAVYFQQLKEKSLLQRRNKSKIKAYDTNK